MVAERWTTTAWGIEPRRQPPFGATLRSRCRQRETVAAPAEQAGAAPRGQPLDVERLLRDVDGVVLPPPMQVGMRRQPRTCGAGEREIPPDGHDLGDLEPTEQPVHVRSVRYVPPFGPIPRFHGTEPAKEQKKVARPNTLIFQMALSFLDLPKGRPPAGRTRKCVGVQIRIQMAPVLSLHSTVAQTLHDQAERRATPPYVPESRRTSEVRNRQGQGSTVRKNGTGHAAVL